MKKKLLYVTPYFLPDFEFGGPVRLVAELSERLAAQYTVTVATYQHVLHRQYEDSTHYSIQRFAPVNRWLSRHANLYYSPALNRALPQLVQQADIVHTHDYRSFHNIVLAKLCRKYRKSLIMSSYKSITPGTGQVLFKLGYDGLFSKRVLGSVSQFIAVNQFEVNDIKRFGIAEQRISIIPNCIEPESIAEAVRGQFRAKYHISADSKVLLFFARLNALKRPDLVVQAFAELVKPFPNTTLVLFGPDGGELHNLQKLVSDLQLDQRTIIIPEAAVGIDKQAAYLDTDLLVLPSPYNEFPLVLLEAMQYGLPIITAEQSIKSYIHEHCGQVVQPTVKILVQAITKLLTEPNLWEQYHQAGPEIFKQNFTLEKYTNKLSTIYQEYLGP